MSSKILVFATILAVASLLMFNFEGNSQPDQEFYAFKTAHSRVYANVEEEQYRKSVFMMNLMKIKAHNADSTNSYTLSVNQFADLTQQEFVQTYLNTRPNLKITVSDNFRTMKDAEINGEIDWTTQGKVSEIKNQGRCGSCWAFSATGAIESANLIASGSKTLISEQQLVDCSRSYGNMGCNGGWMDSAFKYIKDHGITTEKNYPYKAVDQTCDAEKEKAAKMKITGFVDVPGCDNLQNALANQPISVAVDASTWSLYSGGVLDKCGTAINHGVLVVGATDDYWKIKNSWGEGWGEKGFIRIAKGNTCAVCGYASYPTV